MNFKKLPNKQDEVKTFNLGGTQAQLIEITDENKAHVLEVALSMYTGEPCRICGELIQETEFKHKGGPGIVYAGYSMKKNGRVARSAHKSCWKNRPAQAQWAYPDNDDE